MIFIFFAQIFYFINEEIANLNRNLTKVSNANENDFDNFKKIFKLLQVCLITSKYKMFKEHFFLLYIHFKLNFLGI